MKSAHFVGGTEPTVYVVAEKHAMRQRICSVLLAAGLRTEAFASAEEFMHWRPSTLPGGVVLLDCETSSRVMAAAMEMRGPPDILRFPVMVFGRLQRVSSNGAGRPRADEGQPRASSEWELIDAVRRAFASARTFPPGPAATANASLKRPRRCLASGWRGAE